MLWLLLRAMDSSGQKQIGSHCIIDRYSGIEFAFVALSITMVALRLKHPLSAREIASVRLSVSFSVCLACSAARAIEAISLALPSVSHRLNVPMSRQCGSLEIRKTKNQSITRQAHAPVAYAAVRPLPFS